MQLVYQGDPEQIRKHACFEKIMVYDRAIVRLRESQHKYRNRPKEFVKRAVVLLVKQFILLRQVDPEFARTLDVTEPIVGCLKYLSIRELVELFPVDKYWDREKICLDYDTTMEHLKKYDWDAPMGDKTEEILSEYVNKDIRKVNIDHTLACLHRYEEETGESPLMEMLQQEGVEVFQKQGPVLIGNKGTVLPLSSSKPKKRIPPYLRLVK